MSDFTNAVPEIRSSSFKNFLVAFAHEEMNPRKRSTMEDVHRIVPDLMLDNSESHSYFGVYDGHGGRQIVDYLENALERNVAMELQQDDDASISERLTRAFLITDMQSQRLNIGSSGSTAVIALISRTADSGSDSDNRMLHVANAGDSRAVLVCETSEDSDAEPTQFAYFARRLSFDHRPDDVLEQQRIKDAGGFVLRNRVLGILAVSRSFGDHGMKDYVCASPYISETRLGSCGHCPFLILACDGVWDVFSDQEAADLILAVYHERGRVPFEDAARMLVHGAIERGSADNVTAIVVFL